MEKINGKYTLRSKDTVSVGAHCCAVFLLTHQRWTHIGLLHRLRSQYSCFDRRLLFLLLFLLNNKWGNQEWLTWYIKYDFIMFRCIEGKSSFYPFSLLLFFILCLLFLFKPPVRHQGGSYLTDTYSQSNFTTIYTTVQKFEHSKVF